MSHCSHVHSPQPVIVVAPDSFKGSLSALGAAQAIAAGIRRACPAAAIRLCPMADGGEGSLDAFLAGSGVRREIAVRDATGAARLAGVGFLHDGSAVIEIAEIVGITDVNGMRLNVKARSTRGVGDAIRLVARAGAKRVFVALGGSSTNDGGAGLLAALGVRFSDAGGQPLEPTPEGLRRLARVDASALDPDVRGLEIVAMSDVENPLTGVSGATAVFGPQKGVQPDEVAAMDAVLEHYADCLEASFGRALRGAPGAGAAGGLGYALLMLGATLRSGAEAIADQLGLDRMLEGADWLITGEGRSDAQTLAGKAPFVTARRAQRAGVPATLLSGAVDSAALPELAKYFTGCFSPAAGPMTLREAVEHAAALLADCAEQLTRLKFSVR